ncbi:MAG: response regulator transcription factor [Bdellovibrionales bacterium]|nr:response regulator transcription factor [Bdellovibrionales bacterium]
MKILIVDDEVEILKKMTFLAESDGGTVKTATSATALQQVLKNKSFYPHVIVLDRLLQNTDSVSLIGDIKSTFADTKIIIVSAIDTPLEKARALDAGADDYLAKPFSAVELSARIKALYRRKDVMPSLRVELGNLALDKESRSLLVGQEAVPVSAKEYQLLILFCENPGKIYPREVLLSKVWNSKAEVDTKVVEATINNLRRKLESSSASVAIKNARNVGYWLEA